MSKLYKEICGDALNPVIEPEFSGLVIIPHICNNVGRFGAGFAKAVANKYPDVKMRYKLLKGQYNLGDCQFVLINTTGQPIIVVCNMIAQNGLISNSNQSPIKYEALIKCMIKVREYIINTGHIQLASIHCPRFGSGLAGGNWDFIKILIKEIWCDYGIPVTVYCLKDPIPYYGPEDDDIY
jgi:hypothetical protein